MKNLTVKRKKQKNKNQYNKETDKMLIIPIWPYFPISKTQ